jgi:phage-related protein
MFKTFGQIITDNFKVIGPANKLVFDALGLVVDLLTGKWGRAWDEVKRMFSDITGIMSGFGHLVEDAILQPFRALGIDVPKAVTGFFSWLGGLPGQVISAIGDLATPLWNAVSSAFTGILGTAQAAVTTFWTWVTGIPKTVVDDLVTLGTQIFGAISAGFGQAINGAAQGISSLWGWVGGVVGTIVGYLGDLGTAIFNFAASGFSKLLGGAQAGVSALAAGVKSIGDGIVGDLGDVGVQMYDFGVHILQRLIDGVGSMVGSLASAVGGAIKKGITDLIPHSPAKAGPLSGSGWDQLYTGGQAVTKQFAAGLGAVSLPELGTTAGQLLSGAGGPSSVGAALSSGYSGPAVVIQNATFNDKADIDTFMRQAAWTVQTKGV